MRKLIYNIFIFVILFVMLSSRVCFGAYIENIDDEEILLLQNIYDAGGTQTTQDVLTELKNNYGYEGDLTNPIRIRTKVTIQGEENTLFGGKKYYIKIGERQIEGRRFSESALRSLLGYEDSFGTLSTDTSWDVVIDASVPKSVEEAPIIPAEYARTRNKA